MHTINILTTLVLHHQFLAYFFIFLGLIFEGEIVVISVGILANLGAIDFWLALLFIFAGGVVKTLAGYYLGGFLYKKYNHNKFFSYIEKRIFYFMPRFRERPFWSIFISKFIMGLNYLVVIFSGYQKIDFKTYLKAEFFSTLIWAPLLLSLGYFFSHTALGISREISKFFMVIFICLAVFLLFDKFVSVLYRIFEFFRNGIEHSEEKNEK